MQLTLQILTLTLLASLTILVGLLVKLLRDGLKVLKATGEQPAPATYSAKLAGLVGTPVLTELGQFMPKEQPASSLGVTKEEVEWALENGAKDDEEAATLIEQHRRIASGQGQ